MTTRTDASAARPPDMAQRLTEAAAAIEQVPTDTPAVVQLAHAWNGFHVTRTVTVLLSSDAVPHRDAYDLAEGWCTQALDTLYDVIGERLVHKHAPGHSAGRPFLEELAVDGRFELYGASQLDLDRIAAAMIRLAARLDQLLTNVADTEEALPELRAAARAAAMAAHNIWSHYGGDSAGW